LTYYFLGLPDSSSKATISHAGIMNHETLERTAEDVLAAAVIVICRGNLDVIIRKRGAVIISRSKPTARSGMTVIADRYGTIASSTSRDRRIFYETKSIRISTNCNGAMQKKRARKFTN